MQGCISDGRRDPAPLGLRILHSLALHVVITFYPFLEPAIALRYLLVFLPRKGGPPTHLIPQALATQLETLKLYRLGRAHLRLQKYFQVLCHYPQPSPSDSAPPTKTPFPAPCTPFSESSDTASDSSGLPVLTFPLYT